MRTILGTAKKRSAQRVRVVNLAVYDPRIQPAELLQMFERLTRDTTAHGARLHIRCCEHNTLPSLDVVTIAQTAPRIRLDSIELE